jgi:hypothetical protein
VSGSGVGISAVEEVGRPTTPDAMVTLHSPDRRTVSGRTHCFAPSPLDRPSHKPNIGLLTVR